ncbi:MAG: hypothetical protein WB699_03155 [Bacteroidota bacterium]
MNARSLRPFLLVLLMFPRCARAGGADSSSVWVPGIFFSVDAADGSLLRNGNTMLFTMAPGYDFSPVCRILLSFTTGRQNLSATSQLPVSGALLFGGAGLEGNFLFQNSSGLDPYLAGGIGISTILNTEGAGYNGWFLHFGIGIEHSFESVLAVDANLRLTVWKWPNGVSESLGPFAPFHAVSLSAGVRIIFHPEFHLWTN